MKNLKVSLRNRLSEMKFLIIDKFSMESSDLWTDIDSRLGEILMVLREKEFAGLSVTTVVDLLQLTLITGKPIFSQLSDKGTMKDLLGLQLRHLFKEAELCRSCKTKR